MALTDLRIALRRYWYVAVAAMAFWLLVGSAMSFLPAPKYETSASLVAEPVADDAGTAIQIAGYQLPVILATIESRAFVANVRADLPATVADASVSINAGNAPGTPLVYITTTGEDPEAAAQWATALARAAVADRADTLLTLNVLDVAPIPSSAISPKPAPILVGTFVIGLLSAVLGAVIIFRLRKALDLAEELQRRLDLPIIGQIPTSRALRRKTRESASEILLASPEMMEAFRSLSTNLELAFLDDASPVVSVVSWGEAEGKSTIAAGIALTTASSGHDVIAVDADLRHPELHSCLGQPFGEGLADAARRDLDTLVGPTWHPHLWFLPAGIPDRHPADVLAVTLADALQFGRAARRRMVIDAPPFHGLAETLMVLVAAHNVVIVVDSHKAKLVELESMVARMRAAGVNIVGVVLNRVARRRDSAYPAYRAVATHRLTTQKPVRALPVREPRTAAARQTRAADDR